MFCCVCNGSCCHIGPHSYCDAHRGQGYPLATIPMNPFPPLLPLQAPCPTCGRCPTCGQMTVVLTSYQHT